jgi:hypothetical protein
MDSGTDITTVACVAVGIIQVLNDINVSDVIITVISVIVTGVRILDIGRSCSLEQALLVEYVDTSVGLCSAVIGTLL